MVNHVNGIGALLSCVPRYTKKFIIASYPIKSYHTHVQNNFSKCTAVNEMKTYYKGMALGQKTSTVHCSLTGFWLPQDGRVRVAVITVISTAHRAFPQLRANDPLLRDVLLSTAFCCTRFILWRYCKHKCHILLAYRWLEMFEGGLRK